MELDLEIILAEAATKLSTSVVKLIQCGAHGTLMISVIANDWAIRTENETAETISGLVALVPDDLLQSYGADFTRIHQVVTDDDGEVVTLRKPIDVNHAVHFVTAEEFARFRDKYGGVASRDEEIPPYMDPSHNMKSPQLAAAIQAWMALFASGEFDPEGKSVKRHIEQWLVKNHSELSASVRKNIATLIIPKIYKKGGPPRTPGNIT